MRTIRPSGTGLGHCINCYLGCSHLCSYCYARFICHKSNETWQNAIPRLKILNWLKHDVLSEEARAINDIFVCSFCDAYQPLELTCELTRSVIEMLIANNLPFTVLTKSIYALRDLDLFSSYENCRVGFSMITLDENFKQEIEPYSSPAGERCGGSIIMKRKGVSTILSVEPILEHQKSDPFEIVKTLKPYIDLFVFGKWSPYIKKGISVTYNEQYYIYLFKELIEFCVKEKVYYCIAKHTEPFLRKHGFEFVPFLLVTDRPYPEPFGSYMGKRF